MKIALIVLGVWVVFAFAWGKMLVRRERRRLSPEEVWRHGKAARHWMKTGDLEAAREMLRR